MHKHPLNICKTIVFSCKIAMLEVHKHCFGCKNLEINLVSRWEGVRLPRASGKSPGFFGSSPNFPGSFSATSPEVLSLWNLTAIQGFPGSFPDFPGGQPLSLGSLTPSPDSQKHSLKTLFLWVFFFAHTLHVCAGSFGAVFALRSCENVTGLPGHF